MISLSKDDRSWRTIFQTGFDRRNPNHLEFLRFILEGRHPPTPDATAGANERKKKWTVESTRAFFLEVARRFVETGKSIISICADLKQSAVTQLDSPYRALSARSLEDKFSKLFGKAVAHLRDTNEAWLGIGRAELQNLIKKIKAERTEQRKQRARSGTRKRRKS
jgi:hypothetical protein